MRIERVVALLFVTWCLSTSACISNTVVNIGQKSSLEKQLMGEVEPLTEEEMLIVSVRASGMGTTSRDDLAGQALAARRRQLFNRDDVEELKGLGCLAEGRQGRLVEHECSARNEAELMTRLTRMVAEENADRSALLDWAISTDPVLTRADRGQLEEMLGRLFSERAKAGDWLEQPDGSFKQK